MERADFAIKGFKSFNTHDGYAFECSLYVKGKRTAVVTNGGYGGENEIKVIDRFLYKDFHGFVSGLPPVDYKGLILKYDEDLFIDELINKFETDRFFRRNCKKKTVIILPEHKKNECLVISRLYKPEHKTSLLKKYPEAKIMNEVYA